MANVKFLRGLQANLPQNGSAVDGVFYLTTDTNRLYVGQGTNRTLLNQTVQIVADINDLTAKSTQWRTNGTAASHINDFYYISGSNVLAVFTNGGTDGGWVQINPDTNTYIESSSLTATAGATDEVNLSLSLTDNNNTPDLGASIGIVGDGSAHVSVDDGKIKITGDTYALSNPSVSSAAKEATATVNLTQAGTAVSALKIKSSNTDTLEVTSSGDTIVLNVPQQDNTTLEGGTTTISVNNGTMSIEVSDSDNNTASGNIDRVGIVLNDGSYAQLTQAGQSATAGAIYSKNEIDEKLSGLDGMTYKGTLGSTGTTSTLPTSGVQNGDTYVIIDSDFDFGAATIVGGDPALGVNVGDMIIAKGTETLTTVNGESGYYITNDLTWTYVPAGNDSLDAVTYHPVLTAVTNTTSLQDGNNNTLVQQTLTAGTQMAISSQLSSGNGRTDNILATTISHGTITTTTPEATSESNGTSSFVAITGLQIDNGHVTSVIKDTFTPVTYEIGKSTTLNTAFGNNNLFSSNGTANSADVTISLSDSNGPVNNAVVNVESSSLYINATTNGISVNLEWGEF